MQRAPAVSSEAIATADAAAITLRSLAHSGWHVRCLEAKGRSMFLKPL